MMRECQKNRLTTLILTGLVIMNAPVFPVLAHDPVFGLGPHVLFKGGVEIAPQVHISKVGNKEKTELDLELTYGLTGDWAAGIEIPYLDQSSESGFST